MSVIVWADPGNRARARPSSSISRLRIHGISINQGATESRPSPWGTTNREAVVSFGASIYWRAWEAIGPGGTSRSDRG